MKFEWHCMVKVNIVVKTLYLHTSQNHENVSLPGTMKPSPYVLMENRNHNHSFHPSFCCVSEFAISPGSRTMHPNEKEICQREQETCMDE